MHVSSIKILLSTYQPLSSPGHLRSCLVVEPGPLVVLEQVEQGLELQPVLGVAVLGVESSPSYRRRSYAYSTLRISS